MMLTNQPIVAQVGCLDELPDQVANCWPVEFRPSALAYQSIILQDGTTALERKMYLSDPDPDTCEFPNTLFGAYEKCSEFHIVLHPGIQSLAECRRLCLLNPECVSFIYGTRKRCNLRKGRMSAVEDGNYVSGFNVALSTTKGARVSH